MAYQIICNGSAFNAYGPTPNDILSTHRTERAARAAFDRLPIAAGCAALIDGKGQTIVYRLC
jgi:hypothetical protein